MHRKPIQTKKNTFLIYISYQLKTIACLCREASQTDLFFTANYIYSGDKTLGNQYSTTSSGRARSLAHSRTKKHRKRSRLEDSAVRSGLSAYYPPRHRRSAPLFRGSYKQEAFGQPPLHHRARFSATPLPPSFPPFALFLTVLLLLLLKFRSRQELLRTCTATALPLHCHCTPLHCTALHFALRAFCFALTDSLARLIQTSL